MLRFVLATALAATLASAAPAVAAPIVVTATDPVDAKGGPSVDLEEVRSSYDAEDGAWSVTVRLYGGPSEAEWAMVNTRLTGPSSDGAACATELASMRASTKPGGGNGTQLSVSVTGDFTREAAQSTKTVGPGERELTLSAADPALAGLAVSCVTVTLSHNGVLDTVAPLRFPPNTGRVAPPANEVPRQPLPPPPPGTGTGTPGDPSGPTPPGVEAPGLPPTVVFAQSARRLRVHPDGSVRVTVLPFASRTSGRVVLRSRAGKVLGAGPFSSPPRRTVSVKVRLSAVARRTLRRRGRLTARLTATARDASSGRTVRRTLRTTVVR